MNFDRETNVPESFAVDAQMTEEDFDHLELQFG